MKKLFVTSDIHSYYDILKDALEKASFDINNPDHILVVCGDVFDRGDQSLEVYKFLKSLPKERLILIRGNHEQLYKELLNKRFPDGYDFSNHTVHTFCQISGYSPEVMTADYWFKLGDTPYERIEQVWKEIRSIVEEHPATKWVQSDDWINYLETDNYIFVHSWIPVTEHGYMTKSISHDYFFKDGPDTFREDWRNATQTEWEDATWGCPWKKAIERLNKTGKTIVCGHWHTSDFFNHLTSKNKYIYDCPIFKSKKYKLIGLDACTAGSGKINILQLDISDEEWERWK